MTCKAAEVAPELIDATVVNFMVQNSLPSLILNITKNGQNIRNKAYGLNCSPDVTVCREVASVCDFSRIGSVTKTMTTFIILQLADQKLLSLDDKLAKWYPQLPKADQVTMRQLGNMTSGIPSYSTNPAFQAAFEANSYRIWTIDELLAYAYSQPYLFPPGTAWYYSNTNTILLGSVASKVLKKSIVEIFRQYIAQQFGMCQTYLAVRTEIPDPHLIGTDIDNGIIVDTTHFSPSWADAAGAVISRLDNMRVWSRVIGKFIGLSSKAKRERIAPTTVGLHYDAKNVFTPDWYYSFGVEVNHGWIGHNGSIPGYNTVCFSLMGQDTSIIIFIGRSNTEVGNYASNLWQALAQIITPDHVPFIPNPEVELLNSSQELHGVKMRKFE